MQTNARATATGEGGASDEDAVAAHGNFESAGGDTGESSVVVRPESEGPIVFPLVVLDLDGTLVHGTRGPVDGARELVHRLAAGGRRVAVASLCGQQFLDAGLTLLGHDAPLVASRCLASPGCGDKRDMLADLCLELGTRSALLMGDTDGDRRAAHAAGLPFVHFRGSGAPALEALAGRPADPTVERLDDLHPLLDRRLGRIAQLWTSLGEPRRVGVIGVGGSGAATLADELARWMARELRSEVVMGPRWGLGGDASGDRAPSGGGSVDDRPLVLHGAGVGLEGAWEDLDAVVEVRAAPSLTTERLRALFEVDGPEAVRAARERQVREQLAVARATQDRLPDAFVDGGDVFGLGR